MGKGYFLFLVLTLTLLSESLGGRKGKGSRGGQGGGEDFCVPVKSEYRVADVTTCSFGALLKTKVDELEAVTKETHEKAERLVDDVATLEGNNSRIYRVFAIIQRDIRRFCEIYTISEAEEICVLLFGRSNPNPHFAHIPCGPDGPEPCPDKFWRLKPGCFRPNNGLLPIFNCFVDPDPEETCRRPVYIGCEGYTENIEKNLRGRMSGSNSGMEESEKGQ